MLPAYVKLRQLWLNAHVRDSASTILFDERLPRIKRLDDIGEFYLRTEIIYTPLAIPLSIEIDLGGKGQGLTVRSVDTELLRISGIDIHQQVELRLPSDEITVITLREKQLISG